MYLAITPADAHALTMVAILAFALGSLMTMFFVMAQSGKRNAELDLPELEEPTPDEPKTKKPRKEKESKEALADWEQEADWWK